MHFGIDAISFYTSNYYLDLKTFAAGRGKSSVKFIDDLGQHRMSIAPPNEDIVTMAANGVDELLAGVDTSCIELVIFATETGIDTSKAAATHIHKLFNLPRRCRVVEIKQACYGATFGLQMALPWLQRNENSKVLLIAADIARYDLHSVAESSQGGGAIAMLLSANPKLLAIDDYAGFCTKETMDFWRPNYLAHALVDGRLSCDTYMRLAEESFAQYAALSNRSFSDHRRFCYHVPLAKLVERTHGRLAKVNGLSLTPELLSEQIHEGLIYAREVGNCYTASLYLGILSLLENSAVDLSGSLIGLYSYGSGSVAEFFAAQVVPGYENYLPRQPVKNILDQRQELSFSDYEKLYQFKFPQTGEIFKLPTVWHTGKFCLKEIRGHRRIYEKLE